jgi:hypothetical protein
MLFLLLPMAATAGEKKEGGDAKAEVDWRFDPASLAREICGKNGWPVLGELATPLTRKWIRHFRFFEILKPINGSKAHVVVLVVSSEQKHFLLHQTLPYDALEKKDFLYPCNPREAVELATLKELLSQDSRLWAPNYVLRHKQVEKDMDRLVWKVTLTYHRPALRALPGPAYGEGDKPPLEWVPLKGAPSAPKARLVRRTIELRHAYAVQIPKLIVMLGDEDWHTRETATRRLVEIGKRARPYLLVALNSPDPEVEMRARMILRKIK